MLRRIQTMFLIAGFMSSKGLATPSGDSLNVNPAPYQVQQKSTFLTFFYGPSLYIGDLGGRSAIGSNFFTDFSLKKKTAFGGIAFSYIRKEALGIRLSYCSGSVAGGDEDAVFRDKQDPAYQRYKRNLNFKSTIKEWSFMTEVYPLKFLHKQSRWHRAALQPYLMAGIGRFRFNPQGSYYDQIGSDFVWVDLQPLRTEGQGMKEYPDRKIYATAQYNLPYGFGLVYPLGRQTRLGFEFVGRKLFTDYLDDVSTTYIDPALFDAYLSKSNAVIAKSVNNKSAVIDPDQPFQAGDQRGNATNTDAYYSFNLKFSIQINKQKKKRSGP